MLNPNIYLENKVVLVTGAAGFIGSNLVMRLFRDINCVTIVGIDNMNSYYDVNIKKERLSEIEKLLKNFAKSSWTFVEGNIADKALIDQLFEKYHFNVVVNLAAQAGVCWDDCLVLVDQCKRGLANCCPWRRPVCPQCSRRFFCPSFFGSV